MPIVNWSLFIIIIFVHARFDANLLSNADQGFIGVLSFQSAPPLGSTPDHRLSLEHSNTEVVPREALSQRSETGARDEYEELIHSYSVRRLAHWIRLSSNATVHLCYDFNFFVLLALIYWKGRPSLTAALQARSQLIPRTMEEAQQLSKDARRRLARVETLWAQLDSKIAAIRVIADAQLEKQEQALLAADLAAFVGCTASISYAILASSNGSTVPTSVTSFPLRSAIDLDHTFVATL